MTIYDEQAKKWKVGKKGKAIYNSEREANKASLDNMITRINKAKEMLDKKLKSHS